MYVMFSFLHLLAVQSRIVFGVMNSLFVIGVYVEHKNLLLAHM